MKDYAKNIHRVLARKEIAKQIFDEFCLFACGFAACAVLIALMIK